MNYLANTSGPTLSSFDTWLFIRSLKTLPLRFERQEANAKEVGRFLRAHPAIKEVLYPNAGAMISIRVLDETKISGFFSGIKGLYLCGKPRGVESLITYPTTQTHADIPQEVRESYGLTPDLLRISIGIESSKDLIDDLENALKIFK